MTLKEAWTTWSIDGIFHTLTQMPWTVPAGDLDYDYYLNHSGEKTISPLVEAFLDINNELTLPGKLQISSIIKSRFQAKWGKLYNTLSLDYNPINNYDMIDVETRDLRTSANNANDTYAFNSANPSPSDKQTASGTDTGTITTTRHGNIGVMSTQDLINQEREVWMWEFFEQVYKDIDSVLVLKIY